MKLVHSKLRHRIHITTTSSYPFFLLIRHRNDDRFFSSKKPFFITSFDTQTRVLGRLRCYSTMARTILANIQFENAIEDRRFNDSWTLCEENMKMGKFPRKPLLNKLLSSYAQSHELQWLEKAYGLVEITFDREMQCMLEKETLISLSLRLAERGLPVHASTILRKLIEMKQFPHVGVWNLILSHIIQTHPGSHLAAELLLEVGSLFVVARGDVAAKVDDDEVLRAMKPNTISFNVVLAGCVLSGITRKAEEILTLLHRMRVVRADDTLLILMAHVCERNARKPEIRRLQIHIMKMADSDDIDVTHLVQFFNLLLRCYLKVGDPVSASQAVLEMLEMQKEPPQASPNQHTSCSSTSRSGDSDEKAVREMLGVLIERLQIRHDLVMLEHGVLKPTQKLYTRLIISSLAAGKFRSLAEFLTKIENIDLNLVINSCISLKWLDQARGILKEVTSIGIKSDRSSLYISLLVAYVQAERMTEAKSLLQDIEKAGIQLDKVEIPINSRCHPRLIKSKVLHSKSSRKVKMNKSVIQSKPAAFATMLLETREEEKRLGCGVHDWNNAIHYFSKFKLMKDANKAFRKMVDLGLSPTSHTFHSLVKGYHARRSRNKVKVFWCNMKSFVESKSMEADQEILDLFLEVFVRISFFEGAVVAVEEMEEKSMFVDRYKYRALMLKLHGRYLKDGFDFHKEARMEAAAAFQNWLGL